MNKRFVFDLATTAALLAGCAIPPSSGSSVDMNHNAAGKRKAVIVK